MNAIVPFKPASSVVPLGTAAWYRAEGAAVRKFVHGDLFLGRLVDGMPTGYRDDTHVLLCSGTRGGKGTSVIIPNLCMWPGSAVIIDPKGENAMVTARARGRGSRYCRAPFKQSIRILDPFNAVSTDEDDFADIKCCFNPLDMIDVAREESVDEAGRIADALIVSEDAGEPFWNEAARDLLKAVILHVATWRDFLPHERNLVTVRRLVTAGDAETRKLAAMSGKKTASGFAYLFAAMRRNQAFGGTIAYLGEMLAHLEGKGERTFVGISQVASTNTSFIDSPGMKRCLAKSDFKLSELKTNPKGTSLYICLPQRFMETHYRWLRMMVTLTITEMERLRQRPASNYPVLMVIDEFPALRRMRVIENAAAQIAGFGVKLMFVVQTLAQLKELYRDNWETLVANAGVKLFFCNDDHFTRAYVSGLIGDCEVVRTVRTFSESRGSSTTYSESKTTGSSVSRSGSVTQSKDNFSFTSGVSVSSSTSETQGTSHGMNQSASGGYSETIQKRALVTPDEIGRLFGDRNRPTALALISGYQPIFIERSFYYKEIPLGGYFDKHPDHPAPPTLPEAKARYEEHKRQLAILAASEKAERELQQRLAAERQHRQETDRRLKLEHAATLRQIAEKRREEALRDDARKEAERRAKRAARKELISWAFTIAAAGLAGLAIVKVILWLP